MLKCKEAVRVSGDYLDHNLPLGKRLAVAFHLLICGDCRRFYRHLRIALQYFQEQGDPEISGGEARDIARRVAEHSAQSATRDDGHQ